MSIDIAVQKAFDFAADLVKQLITLSTAIIALTVTFSKDILVGDGINHVNWLVFAWIAFFVSIACGIWALMALTGTLDSGEATLSIRGNNCRIPTALQILTFLIGIILSVIYAAISM